MLELNIASAETHFYEGPATSVAVPGASGAFEVLPGHCALMALLGPGVIEIRILNKEPIVLYIEAGLMEISNNQVSILADSAFLARESAEDELRQRQKEFRDQLNTKQDALNYNALLKQLNELTTQLNAIDRIRKHRNRSSQI